MSNDTLEINSPTDLQQFLLGLTNSDGTITGRQTTFSPITSPTPDPNQSGPVLSKDVTINDSNNTWARIFLPREALEDCSSSKLPLIVYFHGGGFVIGSTAESSFHDFCADMALQFQATVVSVEYRLAPEHRLPAAYDDAMEAFHWIKTNQDEDAWLKDYADVTRCLIMGGSAGGNIAYHAGLRAAAEFDNLLPLKIKGLILHQPFFGGSERTESETRVNHPFAVPIISDLMWELSLPIGANRDHEYCNPTVGGGGKTLIDEIKRLGWMVLVIGSDGDLFYDWQIGLAKMLKEKGVQVEYHFEEGGYHGDVAIEPTRTKCLHVLKKFVLSLTAH
ncbi:carboxylesterase 1-like [Tripterygium wilfordii]|uniref:Carboxylesterase 1-like n=1 Tax=Tripterygium wilfordii TaxID=458696 RepID=A0A7J7DSZ4_TRIWF|nr:carboxylesterase 1-like [Tripterygium wilfordii]XP_038700208.1 carboxylesterase 1-like [Tripterygium wilfordii]KAF5749264.1 carboxylesterase 1-like [Tripterygium wilfordii]